jgi:hypothetical protein
VSQPWQEMSWPARGPGGGNASPPTGPGSNWSRGRIDLTGPAPGREQAGSPAPEPAGRPDRRASVSYRPGALLTGRGAMLGMFVLSFLGILIATWLHWSPLAGGSFVLGCVVAALRTKHRDLLTVVVSPPLLFFCALVGVKALTSSGDRLVSVAGGTALTLANVAPWLFAGVAISLIIAWCRGLPRCVNDLRRELRGDREAGRAQAAESTASGGYSRPRPGSGSRG